MDKRCFTQEYIDAGMPGWPSDRGLFEAMSDLLRIPMKPAGYSDLKPATHSDLKAATVPI